MVITRETEERFVRMLKNREIIVIQCCKSVRRKTYDYKFIGANSYGKWDFTPLVENATSGKYSYRYHKDVRLAIRVTDAASVICEVLCELEKDGISSDFGSGYSQYEKVCDHLCTFYL